MLKTTFLCLALLLASDYKPIKEVRLERLDNTAVRAGSMVNVRAYVSFNHEACDESAKKTEFYAKGAEIVERSEWTRIDTISFYKTLKVKIKEVDEAIVTVQLVKHSQKATDQLKLSVKH